jgi:Rrf2 family protein
VKLSKKAEYAVRALLGLATSDGKDPQSVRSLSAQHDLPRKFLETVMRDLRQAGLVESAPGKQGGYTLARPPAAITLGQVFDAIGFTASDSPPAQAPPDVVGAFLADLGGEVERLLRETTLDDLLRRSNAGRALRWSDTCMFGDGI